MNTYRIGGLARPTRYKVETIRFYESVGLLSDPSPRQKCSFAGLNGKFRGDLLPRQCSSCGRSSSSRRWPSLGVLDACSEMHIDAANVVRQPLIDESHEGAGLDMIKAMGGIALVELRDLCGKRGVSISVLLSHGAVGLLHATVFGADVVLHVAAVVVMAHRCSFHDGHCTSGGALRWFPRSLGRAGAPSGSDHAGCKSSHPAD